MVRNPSSRERPAKPALSREWIIDETIRIVQEEGLERATMRRVAAALHTGAASLYVYVSSTAELHALVTDALTGVLPESEGGDWQERLEALLGAYRAVLFANPGLARSALHSRPMGPNTLRLVDRLVGLLREGGATAERAAWGADLLILHVTASVTEHVATAPKERIGGERGYAIVDAVRDADPVAFPQVADVREELLSGTPQERMSWGIRAIVAGIIATPTPAG